MGHSTQPPGGFLLLSVPLADTFVFHRPALPLSLRQARKPPSHPPSPPPTGSLRPDLSGILASASCSQEEMKVACLLPFAVSLTSMMYLGHEHELSLPRRLKSSLTCGLLLEAKLWHWEAEGVHPCAKGFIQKEVTWTKILRHCHWNAPLQLALLPLH